VTQTTQGEGATEQPHLTLREWGSRISATARSRLPLLLLRRKTPGSVAAFYDLVTPDARLTFGDNFHFGYFATGQETLAQAHDALTDLVMGLARIEPGSRVLDLGCGIGAPAIRIARSCDCHITGVNGSREQLRQGRLLVEEAGLSDRIDLRRGNALALDLPDGSFDSVLCLETATAICCTPGTETRLVSEIRRVLKPGGHVGFCDFIFTQPPTPRESKAMHAIFNFTGLEPMADWAALFREAGFTVSELRDLTEFTKPTWSLEAIEQRSALIAGRYPNFIVKNALRQMAEAGPAYTRCGVYPSFSAQKSQ
jgi:cyclopropane fatty-acyl-phospholipid synthase-like methyltransferase